MALQARSTFMTSQVEGSTAKRTRATRTGSLLAGLDRPCFGVLKFSRALGSSGAEQLLSYNGWRTVVFHGSQFDYKTKKWNRSPWSTVLSAGLPLKSLSSPSRTQSMCAARSRCLWEHKMARSKHLEVATHGFSGSSNGNIDFGSVSPKLDAKVRELHRKRMEQDEKLKEMVLMPFHTVRRLWNLLGNIQGLELHLIEVPSPREILKIAFLTFITVAVSALCLGITDTMLKQVATAVFKTS